jgi:hypothetical protein
MPPISAALSFDGSVEGATPAVPFAGVDVSLTTDIERLVAGGVDVATFWVVDDAADKDDAKARTVLLEWWWLLLLYTSAPRTCTWWSDSSSNPVENVNFNECGSACDLPNSSFAGTVRLELTGIKS